LRAERAVRRRPRAAAHQAQAHPLRGAGADRRGQEDLAARRPHLARPTRGPLADRRRGYGASASPCRRRARRRHPRPARRRPPGPARRGHPGAGPPPERGQGMSDRGAAEFTGMPDLASRALGGSVAFANDEFFAEKENLIKPGPPEFAAEAFGHKGKVYDGWETRRRRDAGHDHAIVRLGCPGVVHGVGVDTAFFRGNYPPEVSVEAVCADGYPNQAELAALAWRTLVARTAARGDAVNRFAVTDPRRWTHVRLSIYPDGGVARFRVHGEVVQNPALLAGTVDLVALENGGDLTRCFHAFYSSPGHPVLPPRDRVSTHAADNPP